MQTLLFFGRSNHNWTRRAAEYLRARFKTTEFYGGWGEPWPNVPDGAFDLTVSFLSRWRIRPEILARSKTAINIHSGPPEYPGIGCVNWALYENAPLYGATLHRMTPRFDDGEILSVSRFEVQPRDTVETVLERTYLEMINLLHDYFEGTKIYDVHREKWSGRKRSRQDLDRLAEVTPDMDAAEVARRARAVTFGKWTVRQVAPVGA